MVVTFVCSLFAECYGRQDERHERSPIFFRPNVFTLIYPFLSFSSHFFFFFDWLTCLWYDLCFELRLTREWVVLSSKACFFYSKECRLWCTNLRIDFVVVSVVDVLAHQVINVPIGVITFGVFLSPKEFTTIDSSSSSFPFLGNEMRWWCWLICHVCLTCCL